MSHLRWIERDHGWRAGPYEIELAAPQLWVCTRRDRRGRVRVESTAGSLSALKTRIEKADSERSSRRSGLTYLAVFLISMIAVALAVEASASVAPMLVVGFSILGIWGGMKSVDCVIRRSWEALRLNYQ